MWDKDHYHEVSKKHRNLIVPSTTLYAFSFFEIGTVGGISAGGHVVTPVTSVHSDVCGSSKVSKVTVTTLDRHQL